MNGQISAGTPAFLRLGALLAVALLASGCGNVTTNDTQSPASGGTNFNPGTSGGATTSSSGSSGGDTTSFVCTPSERKCDSLAELATCDALGQWANAPCGTDTVCDDAECLPKICEAGAVSCDGAKVVQCSPRGTRQNIIDVCVGAKACIGGTCAKKNCTIGQTECVGNAVVTCSEDHEWVKTECGGKQTCAIVGSGDGQGGTPQCVAHICAPGATTCSDNKVFSCSPDGLTKTVGEDCNALTDDGGELACLAGTCVAKNCVAGTKQCIDGEVAVCKADFSGWDLTECGSGLSCGGDAGETACKKVVCAAKEVYCDGLSVMKCDASGTAKEEVQACNGNLQECKNGGCVDLAIICGDGFCDEGESLENCDKDCTEKITVSPDFDKVTTQATFDQPRAPRGLNKGMPHASYTSTTMAVGGNFLYVVDRDNGTLVMMDRQTLKVAHTLKVGSQPEHVVVSPTGTVWVSVKDDDAIVMLKPGATSMKDAVKWQVGMSPMGMALDHSGKLLLVALFGEDAVVGLSPETGVELARAKGKIMPRGVMIGLSGKAMITYGTGEVGHIDVNAMKAGNQLKPAKVTTGFADLRVDNPTKVCRGILDVPTRKPNRSLGAAMQPESGMMIVGHILANTGTAKDVLASAGVKPKVKKPKPKIVTVCSSSGYGSTCKQVSVLPPMPNPPPPCHSSPVRPYEVSATMYSPDMGLKKNTHKMSVILDKLTKRAFLARFDQPTGMVHHPTMTMAFMTAMGTNNVLVLNTAGEDPMMWPIADIKVGPGPKSIVISPDGKKAWVHNSTGFTVSEIDLAPLLKFNDPLTNGKAMPKIDPLYMQQTKEAAYAEDPLSAKAALGRQIFHNSLNSRLNASNRFACATCHLDGMEDKRVWFVSEGPRQTPALAGRIADTAPFNWMGTKFTLHDNMKNTTTRMGGTGLKQHELDALGIFITEGLKAPRNPNVSSKGLTALQEEGKKLYFDPKVGCNNCHTGPGLTDGAQHDVGTATPLEKQVQVIFAGTSPVQKVLYNTPSLRGLFYTAPYLHDGSAPTLKDALKKTSKTMGRTDHLSDKQLDALVAYLKTL